MRAHSPGARGQHRLRSRTGYQRLREIREEERLGPSTGSIVEEAERRKIPYIRLNNSSLVQLGYGVNQKRIRATIASSTSSIAVEIACDKEETKNLLEAAEIPVPRGRIVRSEEALKEAIDRIKYPIVLKPGKWQSWERSDDQYKELGRCRDRAGSCTALWPCRDL